MCDGMGTRPEPSHGRDWQAPASPSPPSLLGIFDFSYQHYALGDLLTSQVNLAIMAIEQGLAHVDIIVSVNPHQPSAHLQGFITPANYVGYLDDIMPVFSCNPLLRSLQLVRDVRTCNFLISAHRKGMPIWPELRTHLSMRQDFPIDHGRINGFHARNGYLPVLEAPRGYQDWARAFRATELAGRPLAVINPRQSSLTAYPAGTGRDAPLPMWHRFIDVVGREQPDVLFVRVGGFQEWEHRLLHRPNVFIPRAYGLQLAHELAFMKIADLFMGTSSGFATFATFADLPYAILNVQPSFAPHAQVRPNERRYPFAKDDQVLTWWRETTDELLALFKELFHPAANVNAAPLRG
jgi:hypothetical protein